jgi:hypothetical protein
MEKRSWENRKGREISEAGIDLNSKSEWRIPSEPKNTTKICLYNYMK